jgi:hypothetical protein
MWVNIVKGNSTEILLNFEKIYLAFLDEITCAQRQIYVVYHLFIDFDTALLKNAARIRVRGTKPSLYQNG